MNAPKVTQTINHRAGRHPQKYFRVLALTLLAFLATAQTSVRAQNGLRGQYYNDPNNRTYFNTLVLTRVDPVLNFDWGEGSPGEGVNTQDFSARWTGLVQTTNFGQYTFKTNSDDGIRLWISGVLVVDSWIDQAPADHTGTITLAANTQYEIKVEYYERGGGAVARLYWTPPGSAEQIVPTANLTPPPANIVATPQITPVNAMAIEAVPVTITSATPGATIHYTTDGTAPTTSSPLYTGPFSLVVNATTYVTARAFKAGMAASAAQTVVFIPGSLNFTSGFSTLTSLQLNGNAVHNSTSLQLTTASANLTSSFFSKGTVDISAFTTSFTFQQQGPSPSFGAEGITFTIQGNSPTALGGGQGGLGYAGIGNSAAVKFDVFGSGSDPSNSSTGLFLNGAGPYGGTNLLPGINLRSGNLMRADITYANPTLTVLLTDTVTNATDTRTYNVNLPALVGSNRGYVGFTGATGSFYTMTQNIRTWNFQSTASTISGDISLEDCPQSDMPLTFTFRPTDGSPTFEQTVTPASDGGFSVVVPRKSYNVAIKGSKWLRQTLPVNTTNGNVSGVNVLLLGGDANNDNSVDVLDLDQLIQTFDKCQGDAGYLTGADFNCDDCADVLDLDILIRNFDAEGDA
jgi:hypothetical protein